MLHISHDIVLCFASFPATCMTSKQYYMTTIGIVVDGVTLFYVFAILHTVMRIFLPMSKATYHPKGLFTSSCHSL